MSHIMTLVLVPPDVDDVQRYVATMLAPYDAETEVAPYKRYIPKQRVERWAHQYGTGDDLTALATILQTDYWEFGADEHGLYEISTINPQGKWDSWVFGGRFDGLLFHLDLGGWRLDSALYDPAEWLSRNIRAVSDLIPVSKWADDAVPDALITPNGAWHDRHIAGLTWADDAPWKSHVQALLNEYLDCRVVCVDCHY